METRYKRNNFRILALMNNQAGRANVLEHPDAVDIITYSLNVENVKTKISVL